MIDHGFGQRTFTAKNTSGEEIPPFACVQLTPVDAEFVGQTANATNKKTYFAVTKPGTGGAYYDSDGPYCFNGPNKVAINGYGEFRIPAAIPCLALLKSDIYLDDAWNLELGPVTGQWYLDVGSGFTFGGVFDTFPDPQTGFVLLNQAGSLFPVEITETEYDTGDYDSDGYYTEKAAIYRTSHERTGFFVRRLDDNKDMTGDEFTCYADFISGVWYTSSQPLCAKIGSKFQLVTSGTNYWRRALTLEAIDASTDEEVNPATGYVELFPDGPLVQCQTDTGVATTIYVDVSFDDQEQIFKATAQRCENV